MSKNYFPYKGQAEDLNGVPEDWALEQGGIEAFIFQKDFTIPTTDGNGSTYCIMQGVPAGAIISELWGEIDADADFTSLSVGLYDSDLGTAKAIACYSLHQNVAAGSTKLAPFDLMLALTHAQTKQRVWELAGDTITTKKARYDLVATAVTAAGVAQILMTVRGKLSRSQ